MSIDTRNQLSGVYTWIILNISLELLWKLRNSEIAKFAVLNSLCLHFLVLRIFFMNLFLYNVSPYQLLYSYLFINLILDEQETVIENFRICCFLLSVHHPSSPLFTACLFKVAYLQDFGNLSSTLNKMFMPIMSLFNRWLDLFAL